MRLTSLALALSLSVLGCTAQDGSPLPADETGAVTSEITNTTNGYCAPTIQTDWDEYVPGGRNPALLWGDSQHVSVIYTVFSDGFYVWSIGDGTKVLNLFHVKFTDNTAFSAWMNASYAAYAGVPGSDRYWSINGTGSLGGVHPNPPIGPGGFPAAFRNRVLHFAQHQYDTSLQIQQLTEKAAIATIPQGTAPTAATTINLVGG